MDSKKQRAGCELTGPALALYIQCWEGKMPQRRVQIGQVWKNNRTGETYLVTKIYTEALATVAVLRKTGAETEAMLRVKVAPQGDGQTLPGFSSAQESGEF